MLLPSAAFAVLGLTGPTASLPADGDVFAVQAGTIHLVDRGVVLDDGGTMLVRDGRIVAVGADVAIPVGATVVDYGPDAVIVPGFVAASSVLAEGEPSERTAAPDLNAVDGFDFYARHTSAVASGVTSVYVHPARGRLIAGQGAVISLGGDDPAERVLRAGATVHGAISAEARSTPGYWEPPIPATSDVGLGVPENQLPRSTMGAILALDQIMGGVAAGSELEAYGPTTIASLSELLSSGASWRISAVEEHEIRALIEWGSRQRNPLIVDGAHFAGDLGPELAAIGAQVVYEVPFAAPTGAAANDNFIVLGNGQVIFLGGPGGSNDIGDAEMADLDVPARLAEAGVPVAITPAAGSSLRDLRFAASIASRGGFDPELALRAITLVPAQMYGVADQVGSIAPGKRADFTVFNGAPLDSGTSVRATWVGGERVWSSQSGDSAMTVISVDELHLGDGRVMEPGELLIHGHRIVEVARRVSRPAGAVVVRGPAAMPGVVDAGGRLGLSGSRRMPATDFDLAQIVEPGDETDRLVARAGVTTVLLDPRGDSNSGAPIMAYRPAADDLDTLVIESPAAVRLAWSNSNRFESGKTVRKLLSDAVDYAESWAKYEEKLAAYEPEQAAPEFSLPATDDDEEESDEDEDDDEDDDKKKKKKKKKEQDPDPVTGIWLAHVDVGAADPVRTRMQIRLQDGEVDGWLRSAALSSHLMPIAGSWDAEENQLHLHGEGDSGAFTLAGELSDTTLDAEEVVYEATVTYGETELSIEVPRTERTYPVAALPRRPRPEAEDDDQATPKGMPKEPRLNTKLEPLRHALMGHKAVVVSVNRRDEILACVEAFEAVGIQPILLGAEDSIAIADQLTGRVAGVLLDSAVVDAGVKEGEGYRLLNRYAALQSAGIPIAFRSELEGGAAELPLRAAYAVSQGLSPVGALRALTYDAARMFGIDDRVGLLGPGRDGDVLLLDGSPLELSTSIERVWVAGQEVR